jgi:hypothetical protein
VRVLLSDLAWLVGGHLSGRERDELSIVAQRSQVRVVPHSAEVQLALRNRLPQRIVKPASLAKVTTASCFTTALS